MVTLFGCCERCDAAPSPPPLALRERGGDSGGVGALGSAPAHRQGAFVGNVPAGPCAGHPTLPDPQRRAARHLALGRALAPLREEGVLIVASGAITHNFGWLDWQARDEQVPLPQAAMFTDWVAERLAAQDVAALLDYRSAPYGAASHPAEEHFMPLFVALGAAGGDAPLRHRPRFTYGGLAMDAYVWRGQ